MLLSLPRPFAWHRTLDPPRYRVLRRRSMRSALAGAGLLVAIVSALSGLQYVARARADSGTLLLLSAFQACLAVAVVIAMHSRLRRDPGAVAFAYLVLVPIVPLATLRLEPGSVVLVSGSLALIPIVVALFIPWSHLTTLAWSASYLALVAGASVFLGSTSLEPETAWYLLLAAAIGTVFGILGQHRREQQDRLAFSRERTLRSLIRQSTGQQAALERLNVELDRVLAREVRGRQSIEAALAQIDPNAPPDAIAATACAEVVRLPSVDAAWAISLCQGQGRLLAAAGLPVEFEQGGGLPDDLVRELLERATAGPWAESGSPSGHGLAGSIWSPLRGHAGVIGVIGCGTHDPTHARAVAELLPAITTYGSMVGALVAPGLETELATSQERDRIRRVLDARAFVPYFQPIVELQTGIVVGYESLTRFADGTRPDLVFELARRCGLGVELEVATLTASIKACHVLPGDAYVGFNASPDLLYGVDLGSLLERADRAVVVEITEHVAIDDYKRLRTAVEALGPKVRLAVDDAGAGYASLRHILELAPHYAKLDIGLIRGIDADPARQALIAGVGYFAVKRKMRLVAEGIETPAELSTLRSLGIRFGQGYLLGRPRDSRDAGPWPDRIQFD